MKKIIIGVAGKKFSGKDVVSTYLCNKYDFVNLSFARALKEGLKSIFDFSDQQLNGSKKEEIDIRWNVSPRYVMQVFGTEIMREEINRFIPSIGNDFWIKRLLFDIEKTNKNIVISDVRYLNEIKKIKELGGMIIYINRPSIILNEYNKHKSENNISEKDADFVLLNNSSFDSLYKKIDEFMLKNQYYYCC